MIGIINYKMGNLRSVRNSLDYLGIANRLVNTASDIGRCEKLILPGVGAFGMAMENLNSLDFVNPIRKFVEKGGPLLGLCLGMQLLLESSEEHGFHKGLGIIKGKVLSFKGKTDGLPVPHVGWNDINIVGVTSLLPNLNKKICCYFVHSFYCKLENRGEVVGVTDYGLNFDSVFASGKVFGCQFHPEKSQSDGLAILENFNKIT